MTWQTFTTAQDGPDESDDLDTLSELDVGSPPHLVDAGIDLLAPRLAGGDESTLLVYATLCWVRYLQATTAPGRRSEPEDLDRSIHYLAEVLREAEAGSPFWLFGTASLGDRYVERYVRDGRDDDRARAGAALRAALGVTDQDPADRASLWMRLGMLHDARFRRSGDRAARDRSVEALAAGWAEGSGEPLLAMSYVDVLVGRGRDTKGADLDMALRVLATVPIGALPPELQPSHHYFVMAAHFHRHVAGELADLRAAELAATRLVEHRHTEPGLRAEGRVIRATARLDRAFITGDQMADVDEIIADLEQTGGLVSPALHRDVDVMLSRMLAERARRTSAAADVDRAAAYAQDALRRLPDDAGRRAEIGYHLACMLMVKAEAGRTGAGAVDRAIDLFRAAAGSDAAAPRVRALAATQLAAAVTARSFYQGGGGPADVDDAIDRLHDALRHTALDDVNRAAMASGLATVLMARYELRGDLADLQWSQALLSDLREEFPGDPNRHEITLDLAQVRLAASAAAGTPPPVETLRTLAAALDGLAPANPRRVQALRTLAGCHATRAAAEHDHDEWRTAVGYAQRTLAETPPDAPVAALNRSAAGGVLLLAAAELADTALLRQAVDVLADVVADGAGQPMRDRYLGMLGSALLQLYRHDPRPEILDRAVDALTGACDRAHARPGTRGAAEIGMALVTALTLRGDPAGAAAAGLTALRAHAWQVLLQSGTDEALTAARRSADDALLVARASLLAGDPHGAFVALETGRGLVLHAATVARTVPELLRNAGAPDLAAEWAAAPPAIGGGGDWRAAAPATPSDLRFRVLHTLAAEPVLFAPPSPAALRAALATVQADCLVYIFPGTGAAAGLALVVEAGGHIAGVDLPDLHGDWAVPATVQRAVTSRELDPAPLARTDVGRDLADVCAEAWDVAVAPLLEHWRATHDGVPHMVLVLGGALATVPWHAAHSRDGSRRWAIDEAAFSYIASARLLVDVAGRTALPPGPAALIIGNPDTDRPGADLPGAGDEASTILRRQYPAGRYLGRPSGPGILPAGPGTPQDVQRWLTGNGAAAPVLHLACHGLVDGTGPAGSVLLLAAGAVVSAEEILRTARSRPADHPGGLVTLAACTTHRAGTAYDEAVTLATAFLVAGAATAVGSLWPVPDAGTAQLMVAFHDNLAGRRLPPWQALREAQRGMRDTPLTQWAGFVHLGH